MKAQHAPRLAQAAVGLVVHCGCDEDPGKRPVPWMAQLVDCLLFEGAERRPRDLPRATHRPAHGKAGGPAGWTDKQLIRELGPLQPSPPQILPTTPSLPQPVLEEPRALRATRTRNSISVLFSTMSGFRGRGRGGGGYVAAPRGLFVNGNWKCDCEPRLPAVHFETKKPGPNKGRWCEFIKDVTCVVCLTCL